MKTILLPTDFSERADNALNQAIHLTRKINGNLIIYHVYHRPQSESNPSSSLLKEEKHIDEHFRELEESHPELKSISHEFKKLGLSTDNIVGAVQKASVDILVMATKGAKGFGELWGTKTAKIIKRLQIPVFVIPDGASLEDFNKISLACDYSEFTDYHEIEFLVKLAEDINLTVDVVTLNRDEKTMTHKEQNHREMLIKQFEKVKASFSFTHNANIEEGIIEYSKNKEMDMIAILPKSYSFIERLFHESLIEKMVFHSPIPLLVLK